MKIETVGELIDALKQFDKNKKLEIYATAYKDADKSDFVFMHKKHWKFADSDGIALNIQDTGDLVRLENYNDDDMTFED